MKKILLVVLMALSLAFAFSGCGANGNSNSSDVNVTEDTTEQTTEAETTSKSDDFDPADVIDSIQKLDVEDGVTYWDVYLKEDADWDGDLYDKQDKICFYAIKKCIAQTESTKEDANSCSVMGYKADGNNAFCWGPPDSIYEYRIYDSSNKAWTFKLTQVELENFGL